MMMSLAKVYRDVNLVRPVAYWDYNSLEIPWGYAPVDRFNWIERRRTMSWLGKLVEGSTVTVIVVCVHLMGENVVLKF